MPPTRRSFLLGSLAAVSAYAASPALKIVVAGGHPGDPECGCGGTIARYAALGHEVTLLYLNRGEGFCQLPAGKGDASQCAATRTAEAQKACRILKARAAFASQIDGEAVVDQAHYQEFRRLVESLNPDVIFTQWPIDEHRDHRAVSQLTLDAWLAMKRAAAFYYYEVADDTMMFSPDNFVDISSPEIEALRHDACFAHVSQQPEQWYPHQAAVTRFRGAQSGHPQAEAFVRHWESKVGVLP